MLMLPQQARLMISHDDSDPYFRKIVSPIVTSHSIAYITSQEKYLFVHSLDQDNITKELSEWNITTYTSSDDLWSSIYKVIEIHQTKEILLNYSTLSDNSIDVLGHGTYLDITSKIREKHPSIAFGSAENLLYSKLDVKTPEQLKKMKITAQRAHDIIIQTLKTITVGMSEQDTYSLCHQIMIETQETFFSKNSDVIHETYARGVEHCPIVLSGENFVKGGHATPSNRIIQPGDTVYIDFGVKLTFKNGESRSSDLQRMAYVLQDNETSPPIEIQQKFDTIIKSINIGIHNLHPNNRGYHVDELVRKYITDAGYPNYNHSTGHPIGQTAHNPGTAISPSSNLRSHLQIQNHGVYTIEPRIALPNGVSVEEMVVVDTEKGNYTLCPRQRELILIK